MTKRTNANSNSEEPNTAPEADRWYNITLGPSFRDPHNCTPFPKFCTLRYEFKPASIDKSQPGSLHKGKDNKVTVEYHNNQQGKPKVTFEGVSEDYKENDAVLFFDGETFCLERLHRAVKRLRHVRLPGDSAAAAAATTATTLVTPMVESHPSPLGKGAIVPSPTKGMAQQMRVEVEKIDIDNSEDLGLECRDEKGTEQHPSVPLNSSITSPGPMTHESEEHVDILNADDNFHETSDRGNASRGGLRGLDIDINLPHQAETDDEIADVDISGDEADKGPNAAEALRAQVDAEGRKEEISSSSSSSSSDSSESENGSGSGSRSGTSSSDSESSDGDSFISI